MFDSSHVTPVRDSIGSTVYFSTYESVKQLLVKFQGADSPTSPLSVAISGGLCGTAGWIVVRFTPMVNFDEER